MLARTISIGVILAATVAAAGDVDYINASETEAIAALRLCSLNADEIESCEDVAVDCAPSARCSAPIDLEPGSHEVYARAAAQGGEWSEESNRITVTVDAPDPEPLDCLSDPVCRADLNGDGYVSASDFALFLRQFGRSWTAP